MAQDKLTSEQLTQIVAEVEQLANSREAELSREQVQQILQDLNLPPELLEDAIAQVQRREALARQQRRRRWIGVGGLVVGIVAIALVWGMVQTRQAELAAVQAASDRLTLAPDRGDNLTRVDRQANPELYYRVTLQSAPVGRTLTLSCDWIDPSGQIVHQNRYETQLIDREVWNTYCRYPVGNASPAGIWQVQMRLGDRILDRMTFEVR